MAEPRFRWEILLLFFGAALGVGFVILRRERAAEPDPAPTRAPTHGARPVPDQVRIVWKYPTKGPIISDPVVVASSANRWSLPSSGVT